MPDYKDAFIQIDFRWKKRIIDAKTFLKKLEPEIYKAANIIKNQAAWMASGPSRDSGLPIGNFRVRIWTGNYRRLMFVTTKIENNMRIRAEVGSAAIDKKGTAYPKFVEFYTKNIQLSLQEKWKEVSDKVFAAAKKILGS
jgi:hypothetical protein